MCTPWNTIFLECSPRKPRMSVTDASNGRPLSRIQSLTAFPAINPVGGIGGAGWVGRKGIRGGFM